MFFFQKQIEDRIWILIFHRVKIMSTSIEYYRSSLVLVRFLKEAAVLFFLMLKWFLFPCYDSWWSNSLSEDSKAAEGRGRHRATARAVRAALCVSTYGEMSGEQEEEAGRATATTCAVCLSEVGRRDPVRQLSNCRHVFHQRCLDRWLDHDERLSCPLCRAMLVVAGQPPPPPEASWAVERLLYLFGDDLLLAS